MQRDKDMEETEDKGIKRKTRHQVSKGGCSNRTPDVNQKLKGDEEEEEWDEDDGDEEEARKGKKGQEGKGVKGKKVQPKKEKVQPKRKLQYRSTLNIVVKLIRSIPTGQFTPLQVQEIKKTPFAELLLGIVGANLDEAYVRKSDPDVLKLVKQYEGTGGRFKLGGKSVKITAKEVTLIFGIQSGPTRIVLNPTPRVPKSDFADRLYPGPKGQRILTIPLLRKFFAKTVEGTSLQDAKDLARVLCLLLIGTLFFASTQARVSWGYLEFVESLDNSTSYDWATFITEYVIQELNKRASSKPTKVGGYIMGLMVYSSELEPNNEEEEMYRFSQVPEHEADVKVAKLNAAVDKSGDEVVQDTSDEETDSDEDEVVTLRGIITKLTEENAEKDRIILELRRKNEGKNATIAELRRRITMHTQTPATGPGFEGISEQFDKDHLEHENITLQTEIGGLLIEKDIVEEKLEVAGDIIDDFSGENVGDKESKAEKVDARIDKHEIENVEEEEDEEEGKEEEEEGGGIEIVENQGGPEHIMVADADVDSTTVEAYKSILECDTPKRNRGKTKVKVKSSSLTRGVKKTFTRVEKQLDDYVYIDLKKGAKKSSTPKWHPSEAPLIHLLRSTDANLLRQIVDCSDADLHCAVWTNDMMREVVPLEEIMKLLEGGDVSNWMIDGFARILAIHLDKADLNNGNVAYFPCTIWKKYVENYMKDRHAELKNQSTSTEILFEEQNFDAPICSPLNAPQQENTSVNCGVIVCMLMELLAHLEPIPKTLPKTEIDQFRVGLVSRFLNDEGRSWTIKKWEARRMGKGPQ
ncbi:hypothetical protein RHMOL_Rhmol08G0186700 [Rhododendron molle]|uniref:Uncharacterized protein n=1 Tax=Rhododendron molle TaxID=49168 RepID=A0ACC0MPS6_RHOML|nr:hypothetical protein RHMOL_Rhmol08G0186700 [Rhododendron molle]